MNEIVKAKRSEKIKTFSSTVILAQTTTMFVGCNLHMMMHALCKGYKPLPHGLAVQNMYTEMVTGNKSTVVVVRNLNATPIMLKKNTPVARVMAVNAIPNAHIQPGTVEYLGTAQGILTYNSTRWAVTGYSPHYLMFRQ